MFKSRLAKTATAGLQEALYKTLLTVAMKPCSVFYIGLLLVCCSCLALPILVTPCIGFLLPICGEQTSLGICFWLWGASLGPHPISKCQHMVSGWVIR